MSKMTRYPKKMNFNFSAFSACSAVKYFVIFGIYQLSNYNFLCKTNPIFAVFGPKTTIFRKNEPKQTQSCLGEVPTISSGRRRILSAAGGFGCSLRARYVLYGKNYG